MTYHTTVNTLEPNVYVNQNPTVKYFFFLQSAQYKLCFVNIW